MPTPTPTLRIRRVAKIAAGTLATSTLIAACLAAQWRHWLAEAHQESIIRTRLELLGARVYHSWRFDQGVFFQTAANAKPRCFVPGDAIITRVNLASCRDPDLDHKLACLRPATNLRGLELAKSPISNTALQHVACLQSLELLDLSNTSISDEGIPHLRACPRLRWLYLRNTHLTDACIPSLAALKQLQWISLRGTRITPRGIAKLNQQSPAMWIVSDYDPHSWSRPFHYIQGRSTERRRTTTSQPAVGRKKSHSSYPRLPEDVHSRRPTPAMLLFAHEKALTVETGKTGKLPAGSPGHVTAVGDIGRAALSTTPQPRSSAALFTFLDEEHAERPDMNANGLTNGVGMGCKPTVYLRPSQTVRLSVIGLGERQQHAVADPR